MKLKDLRGIINEDQYVVIIIYDRNRTSNTLYKTFYHLDKMYDEFGEHEVLDITASSEEVYEDTWHHFEIELKTVDKALPHW